jgi:DNA-binding transcriptional LysR family regulator
VGETGSFSEAAEKHGVTTSAMSQTLAHLEKTLGARLLTRGRHGPGKLPRAGQVAYEAASNIIRLSGELHRALRRTRESADLHIRLAACHSIGLHQLPAFLDGFNGRHPEVQIQLRYGLIDRVHCDVQENAVDLGLVCYPRRRRGLVVDLFRHERLRLVCHPRHPLAMRVTAFYCQTTCRRDLPTFLTSGFQAASKNNSQSELDAPSILGIDNDKPGELDVHLSGSSNAVGYELQTSPDGITWTTVKFSTQARTIALIGLVFGTNQHVRARALGGSTEASQWSQPMSCIVH